MSKNEDKSLTALSYEDRSAGMAAAATEVEVIKMGNPKASHTEIADSLGMHGPLKEERVENIIRSKEMRQLKETIEARAVQETDNFMSLLVGIANDVKDERILDAMQMVINLWDKRQQEKTINIMIDNRSVSVPFRKEEWGQRDGKVYHLPTWDMAMESESMSDVCRTEGCVHSKQGDVYGGALFSYTTKEQTDETETETA